MRKTRHPIAIIFVVVILIGLITMSGVFTLSSEPETDKTEQDNLYHEEQQDDYAQMEHTHSELDAVMENKINATCTKDGRFESVVYCACGEELSRETIWLDSAGHSYVGEIIDANCTESGYTTYICSVCGDTYNDSFVDALGHRFSSGICVVCGADDKAFSADTFESVIQDIKDCYYDEIEYNLDALTKNVADNGTVRYYDNAGTIRKISAGKGTCSEIQNGLNLENYAAEYYFNSNGELVFVFVFSGEESYRYYIYQGKIIRYIENKKVTRDYGLNGVEWQEIGGTAYFCELAQIEV